jgi:hypothetical protein
VHPPVGQSFDRTGAQKQEGEDFEHGGRSCGFGFAGLRATAWSARQATVVSGHAAALGRFPPGGGKTSFDGMPGDVGRLATMGVIA